LRIPLLAQTLIKIPKFWEGRTMNNVLIILAITMVLFLVGCPADPKPAGNKSAANTTDTTKIDDKKDVEDKKNGVAEKKDDDDREGAETDGGGTTGGKSGDKGTGKNRDRVKAGADVLGNRGRRGTNSAGKGKRIANGTQSNTRKEPNGPKIADVTRSPKPENSPSSLNWKWCCENSAHDSLKGGGVLSPCSYTSQKFSSQSECKEKKASHDADTKHDSSCYRLN